MIQLEFLVDTGVIHEAEMANILKEANELLAIFAASHSTEKAIEQQMIK